MRICELLNDIDLSGHSDYATIVRWLDSERAALAIS
jgi:hypothetical protein